MTTQNERDEALRNVLGEDGLAKARQAFREAKLANVNAETGIPYGVIASQTLNPDVSDDLQFGNGGVTDFVDHTWNRAIEELASEHGFKKPKPKDGDVEGWKTWFSEAGDFLDEEGPDNWQDSIETSENVVSGVMDDVHYESSWLGGALLFFITKSPVVGSYSQCSPCCPNAGDLDTPNPGGFDCYDVPADWRREVPGGEG